jgi:hypothetical protein
MLICRLWQVYGSSVDAVPGLTDAVRSPAQPSPLGSRVMLS